jgi:hypothetical protein
MPPPRIRDFHVSMVLRSDQPASRTLFAMLVRASFDGLTLPTAMNPYCRTSFVVYADPHIDGVCRFRYLDRHVDVPTAARVLGERATANLGVIRQRSVQPNVVALAAKDECTIAEFQGLLIERNPAKGAANASCLAPIQPRLSVPLTRGVVLFANLVDSLRVQIASCFGGAFGQPIEVGDVEPFTTPLYRLCQGFVAKIPKIHRRRLLLEPGAVLVLYAKSEGDLHALPI